MHNTNQQHNHGKRVPNLAVFFRRRGQSLPANHQPRDYRPGDMVTWMLSGNLLHISIISDRKSASGTPLVIHNVGAGTQEEDALLRWPVTGHYRYRP